MSMLATIMVTPVIRMLRMEEDAVRQMDTAVHIRAQRISSLTNLR